MPPSSTSASWVLVIFSPELVEARDSALLAGAAVETAPSAAIGAGAGGGGGVRRIFFKYAMRSASERNGTIASCGAALANAAGAALSATSETATASALRRVHDLK